MRSSVCCLLSILLPIYGNASPAHIREKRQVGFGSGLGLPLGLGGIGTGGGLGGAGFSPFFGSGLGSGGGIDVITNGFGLGPFYNQGDRFSLTPNAQGFNVGLGRGGGIPILCAALKIHASLCQLQLGTGVDVNLAGFSDLFTGLPRSAPPRSIPGRPTPSPLLQEFVDRNPNDLLFITENPFVDDQTVQSTAEPPATTPEPTSVTTTTSQTTTTLTSEPPAEGTAQTKTEASTTSKPTTTETTESTIEASTTSARPIIRTGVIAASNTS